MDFTVCFTVNSTAQDYRNLYPEFDPADQAREDLLINNALQTFSLRSVNSNAFINDVRFEIALWTIGANEILAGFFLNNWDWLHPGTWSLDSAHVQGDLRVNNGTEDLSVSSQEILKPLINPSTEPAAPVWNNPSWTNQTNTGPIAWEAGGGRGAADRGPELDVTVMEHGQSNPLINVTEAMKVMVENPTRRHGVALDRAQSAGEWSTSRNRALRGNVIGGTGVAEVVDGEALELWVRLTEVAPVGSTIIMPPGVYGGGFI